MNRLSNWPNTLLWVIYLALLAVLLPHTAWAFSRFEPQTAGWLGIPWGIVTAWAAAFAFEAAIAALTHRLARRIEHTPRYTAGHVLLSVRERLCCWPFRRPWCLGARQLCPRSGIQSGVCNIRPLQCTPVALFANVRCHTAACFAPVCSYLG
jgi:hypothetical protein